MPGPPEQPGAASLPPTQVSSLRWRIRRKAIVARDPSAQIAAVGAILTATSL